MRTLLPTDLFRFEQVLAVELSPDGEWLAYEWVRAGDSGKVKAVTIFRQTRTDIWIVRVSGGTPTQITSGAKTATGFFHPMWAPDGERLAFLSIKEEEIRLWIWEKATGSLLQVSNLGVYYPLFPPSFCAWISSEHIASLMWPEGSLERGRLQAEDTRPGFYAAQHWRASWSGETVTADVLDSGTQPPRHAKALAVVDVRRGKTEIIAELNWGFAKLSPDLRYLATFRHEEVFGDGATKTNPTYFEFSSLIYSLGATMQVFDLRKREFLHEPVAVNDREYRSLRWSPTGAEFALFGSTEGSPQMNERSILLYDLKEGRLSEIASVGGRIKEFTWSGVGDLLAFVEPSNSDEGNGRADWWRIDDPGNWDLLTEEMEAAPVRLVPGLGAELIGVANGDLWSIDPRSGKVRNLTARFECRISGITWAMEKGHQDLSDVHCIVSAEDTEEDELLLLKIGSEGIVEKNSVLKPVKDAHIRTYSPINETAVFRANNSTGTYLWAVAKGEDAVDDATQLVETNRWLREVESGEVRQFEYRHLDGGKLSGWVILPPDYTEGRSYPTITDVYAGFVYGDRRPSGTYINRPHSVANLQLLAARGYAVLLPSMPLPGYSESGPMKEDPYLELSKGVLPAVDHLIEMGIADEDRLGLIGHSYGGYSVYGLITQTDRFKAAVASAGISNLVSNYGTFDVRTRYGHMSAQRAGLALWSEAGQGRMGVPPWEDMDRYVRNSPLTYVERVKTPILIIHGDQDPVPIQQAEEFFTALLRQGKRARFARYFGESHIIKGRANVLHRWNLTFEWFDEYLAE